MNTRRFQPAVQSLEDRTTPASFPQILANIAPGFLVGSTPRDFTEVGTKVFFTATTPTTGRELYVTDGTAAGTKLVKDINPGLGDSAPSDFAVLGGDLYFFANDGTDVGLWKSDGTAANTVKLRGFAATPTELTATATLLFFAADDGSGSGVELWTSDGSVTGTKLAKDIRTGVDSSAPNNLTAFNGLVYFSAFTDAQGVELWKSDGTTSGTVLVKDIQAGTGGSSPRELRNLGGTLYFSADDGFLGRELWKSDGTEPNTVMVIDYNPGAFGSNPQQLTLVNDLIYFAAERNDTLVELVVTDGTMTGTKLVKDLNPGFFNGMVATSGDGDIIGLNGSVYFVGTDGTSGFELWKTDGTPTGTQLVKDLNPGIGNGLGTNGKAFLTASNGFLYFAGTDDGSKVGLWKTDGTSSGTTLVKQIHPTGNSAVDQIAVALGRLFFSANDGVEGSEPFTMITAPPSTSFPILDPADDSGVSNSDQITNVTTPTYTGTGQPGNQIQLFIGSTPIGTTTVAANGTWTITVAVPLPTGISSIFARATDDFGDFIDSPAVTIVIDDVPPTVIVTLGPGQMPITNNGPVLFTVTFSEPIDGLSVGDLNLTGTAALGTPIITGSGTTFTVTVPTTGFGTVSLGIFAGASQDIAGNPSTAGSPVSVEIVPPPAPPTFTTPTAPPDTMVGSEYLFVFTADGQPPPTFSITAGMLPAGLMLLSDGTLLGTPTTSGSFTFTITATNSEGTASQEFTINVAVPVGPPPVGPPPVGPPPVGPPPVGPPPVGPPPVSPPPGGTVKPVGQNSTSQFAIGTGPGGGTATLFNPDGTPVRSFTPFPGFTGGVRVAAADFNGDGVAELIAGTGPGRSTQVIVLDGKTGAELFRIDPFEASFTGGVYVSAGDMNGDGVPELVISPDEGGGPRVRIFDGKSFQQLADYFGIEDDNFRGGVRTAVGDLNGDGFGDLLVAAGFGGGPRVAGFEGKSVAANRPTKLFNDFFIFEPTLSNGAYITTDDLDGDGFADIIGGGGPNGGPRVFAISGKERVQNGRSVQVANFITGDPLDRNGVRLTAKDINGDGKADLLTNTGTGSGTLLAYRGTFPNDGLPSLLSLTGAFSGIFVG